MDPRADRPSAQGSCVPFWLDMSHRITGTALSNLLMKRGALALSACLAMQLGAASPASAQATAVATPHQDGAGALERVDRIGRGIWVIRQREPFHLQPVGNVTVIEQRHGLVLIDGGGSPGSARRIAGLIKSLTPKPVRFIAITHWHGDHSLGVATLLKSWPQARVIATAATRDHLFGASMERYPKGAPDAGKTKAFIESMAPFVKSFSEAAQDPKLPQTVRDHYASNVADLGIYLKDIDGVFLPTKVEAFTTARALPDRDRPVDLRFLGRGNTDGDLVAWLPRQNIVATGDLVVAPIPFGFGSYPVSWQFDLTKLIALHPSLVIPGHGAPMRNLDYVTLLRDMLADLGQRMALIGPKEEMDQATKDIAPAFEPYAGKIAGDDPWLRQWFKKYWQNPFSQMLWKESRNIAIEQGKG